MHSDYVTGQCLACRNLEAVNSLVNAARRFRAAQLGHLVSGRFDLSTHLNEQKKAALQQCWHPALRFRGKMAFITTVWTPLRAVFFGFNPRNLRGHLILDDNKVVDVRLVGNTRVLPTLFARSPFYEGLLRVQGGTDPDTMRLDVPPPDGAVTTYAHQGCSLYP